MVYNKKTMYMKEKQEQFHKHIRNNNKKKNNIINIYEKKTNHNGF